MSTQSDPLRTTAQELPVIVIAGDSWACGEWGGVPYRCQHTGLAYFLEQDGYRVIQVGFGGATLNDIRVQIKVALHMLRGTNPDLIKVFVFQTEWHRDLSHLLEYYATPAVIPFQEFTPNTISYLISKWQYSMAHLAQTHNLKIGLIGGCSDTIYLSKFEQEYPGLYVACQSLVSLCLTDCDRLDSPTFSLQYPPELITQLKKMCPPQNLQYLIDEMTAAEERSNLLASHYRWFWPDRKHANRIAHERLFQYLKDKQHV